MERGGVHVLPRAVLAGLLALIAALASSASAEAAPGSLTFLEQHKNGVDGVAGIDQAFDVAISPDGLNAYAVGSGSNSVATFTRNPTTGALTFLEQDVDGSGGVDGIAGARGVAVSPDGGSVYVTGNADFAVATFTRNPTTGALTFLEQDKDGSGGVDGIAGAWGVVATNSSVYVTGDLDSAVAAFSRNPGTGALTFVEMEKDGSGGVDGIANPTGVAVSPDGASVYATGCADSSVVTFTRNPTTSALTFLEQRKNGVGGVTGIACARGVAVAPDGANVYVVGESSDAVATFTRNTTTGSLSFGAASVDGSGGVDGLNGVRDVATSPDGGSVYTASKLDGAIASFTRGGGGALTFLEQEQDGVDGVSGVNDSVSVTVAPSSTNVYTSSEAGDTVVTFTREPTPVTPPPPGGGAATRTITLKASKKKVKKGKKVKLSGAIASTAAACVDGQAVSLQRQKKKGKPFKSLKSLTTKGDGTFSLRLKIKKTAKYQAVVAASTDCGAATSPAAKIKAKKKK